MNRGSRLLKVALWVVLIDTLAFGAVIFFAPKFLVETLGDAPGFEYWWLRWAGGALLTLTLGAALVIRKPQGQGAMVIILASSGVLIGIPLLWSWLAGEYDGAAWFLALTLVATFPVSALEWYAYSQNRELLA